MNGYRPRMQHQGPAENCVIEGRELGWLSCTAYGMAMAADDATRGRVRPDGCTLREATGDITGGLMMRQCAPELLRLRIPLEIHTGSGVCSPEYLARRLWAGRPAVVQGNTGALIGGPSQSTTGAVNHLVALAAVRGGSSDEPTDVLVFDPAADGRRAGIASGPQWWPWSRLLKFMARLHPWGENDARVLGPGKVYCSIYPATPAALPDTGTGGYRVRVAANALVRVYDLREAQPIDCIEGWTDVQWGARASTVACTKPVHRVTCDGDSGAVTVKVLGGTMFRNKYIRVGKGTTVVPA